MRAEYVAAWMAELAGPPAQPLPRVSLIVPISGSCAGLREALRSLAAQDYPDYELIVAAPQADDIPADALPAKVKVALGCKPGRLNMLQAGVRAARRQTA